MFNNVLFPTDGSPASLEAASRFARMAAGLEGLNVTLMVAFTPVDPATSDYDSAVADKHNAYLRHQADQFILKAAAVFAGHGIQVQQRILTGTPISAVIATEADEGGYDLVALGSRGMGMAENAENYLGSVAERVIRRVTVPVLVIPLKGGSETDAR